MRSNVHKTSQRRVDKTLPSRLVELGFEEEGDLSVEEWVARTIDAMEEAAAKRRASFGE